MAIARRRTNKKNNIRRKSRAVVKRGGARKMTQKGGSAGGVPDAMEADVGGGAGTEGGGYLTSETIKGIRVTGIYSKPDLKTAVDIVLRLCPDDLTQKPSGDLNNVNFYHFVNYLIKKIREEVINIKGIDDNTQRALGTIFYNSKLSQTPTDPTLGDIIQNFKPGAGKLARATRTIVIDTFSNFIQGMQEIPFTAAESAINYGTKLKNYVLGIKLSKILSLGMEGATSVETVKIFLNIVFSAAKFSMKYILYYICVIAIYLVIAAPSAAIAILAFIYNNTVACSILLILLCAYFKNPRFKFEILHTSTRFKALYILLLKTFSRFFNKYQDEFKAVAERETTIDEMMTELIQYIKTNPGKEASIRDVLGVEPGNDLEVPTLKKHFIETYLPAVIDGSYAQMTVIMDILDSGRSGRIERVIVNCINGTLSASDTFRGKVTLVSHGIIKVLRTLIEKKTQEDKLGIDLGVYQDGLSTLNQDAIEDSPVQIPIDNRPEIPDHVIEQSIQALGEEEVVGERILVLPSTDGGGGGPPNPSGGGSAAGLSGGARKLVKVRGTRKNSRSKSNKNKKKNTKRRRARK